MEQVKRASLHYNENQLNKVIFDEKNITINQKLNAFIHENIKELVGIRAYLYHLQDVIFTAFNKNAMAVIGNCKQNLEEVYEKYNIQICKLVKDTWHNSNIMIKYFYIKDGNLNELTFETEFVEKPNSQVLYFNEFGNKYTFENFVSSEENTTALEVCQSIACYSKKELVFGGSIVYLHGDASTGKTHLINAICNFYREKGGKVYNTNANTFLRQYVEAVQKQSVFSFQDNILSNEVIIIDDIDDLIGKNGTLNEMQKIIINAVENKKYIILTSKQAPNILSEKNSFFKDILSNSISLKLKSPKEALKIQIAMNYICEKNMNVPISIVRDLVVNFNCNVRELKNYIKKLAIVQSIRKFELNSNLAIEILSDDIKKKQEEKKQISNEEILEKVAHYYNFTAQDLSSKIKKEEVCKARNVAMFLMRKINSANFQQIGAVLNRNHSTIISSMRNIENLIKNDKKFPAELADLQVLLFN